MMEDKCGMIKRNYLCQKYKGVPEGLLGERKMTLPLPARKQII